MFKFLVSHEYIFHMQIQFQLYNRLEICKRTDKIVKNLRLNNYIDFQHFTKGYMITIRGQAIVVLPA